MKVLVLSCLIIFATLNCVGCWWWEGQAIYQIYPRSFKDSDGDGIGDLNGIIDKLKYLKGIGFEALWLNSVFQSASVDYGYDITDFRAVHSDYGTNDDLVNLIARARESDIKIILELVPNHSSDEHEWFNKSAHRIDPYTNYYVWHAGRIEGGQRSPPSNWQSLDESDSSLGSAWTWNEVRGEYYYHKYNKKQPDLNFREPKVQEEFMSIMNLWLEMGVFGFSINSASYIFERDVDDEGKLPDENPLGTTNDTSSHDYLDHAHTQDQDETFELIYAFRKLMDDHMKIRGNGLFLFGMLLTESYSDLSVMKRFYFNEDESVYGAHQPINFELIKHLHPNSNARDIIKVIQSVIDTAPEHRLQWVNWALSNHDVSRAASRLGRERIQQYNTLVTLLRGTSITYYGEELGMTDVCIEYDDVTELPYVCEPNGKNGSFSREDARTPFQWNSSPNSGFSDALSIWLPVAEDFKRRNVALQEETESSNLENFKKLLALKNNYTASFGGDLILDALSDDVLMLRRTIHEYKYNFIALLNFNRFHTHLGLLNVTNFNITEVTIKIVKGNSLYLDNEVVAFETIRLGPYDMIVGLYDNASISAQANFVMLIIVTVFSFIK